MISSFIRYVGGKSKALDIIMEHLPNDIKEYREPMVGSGIVLLGMLQTRKKPDNIIIGDMDYDISNLWYQVINNPKELLDKTIELRDEMVSSSKLVGYNTFGADPITSSAITLINNMCSKFGNYGGQDDIELALGRLERLENTVKYKIYGTANLIGGVDVKNSSYEWVLEDEGDGGTSLP